MKITERSHSKETDDIVNFKFDNGAWASIDTRGSYEYQEDEDDEETYIEGSLEFERIDGKLTLTDFDGCFELPEEVVAAVQDLGYAVDEYILNSDIDG